MEKERTIIYGIAFQCSKCQQIVFAYCDKCQQCLDCCKCE